MGAAFGVGDWALAFASASVVSQLSSSGVGGGLDEGIERGVGNAGKDAGAAAIGVDDAANAGADDAAVDAGADGAAADAGASQFSSSSARIGGGQDIGIERGAEDTDMGLGGVGSAGPAAGSIDGDGIPINVEPLPVFRDTGAAAASPSVGG